MRKKQTNNRMVRINDEIMRESANIIRSSLKDPRISMITTVIKVDTTSDLKYSKIYVSIMGEKEEKEQALESLKNAAGFIRKQLASNINLRNTPELKFILDESLDHSIRINTLLKDINSRED